MADALIQPYLFFSGRCEEALDFYRDALGARVEMILRFKDSPDPVPADMLSPGFEDKIMHSSFRVGETVVMASDGCEPGGSFDGFSLSVALPTAEEAHKVFDALAEGGKVSMPLGRTFWWV